MNTRMSRFTLAVALVASLGMAGCVTQQPYSRPGVVYQGPGPCQPVTCGVVQGVQQVSVQNSNSSALGTVIGAVAGGLLGSTVGRGSGRTAATVVGAVAGGAVGNQVGKSTGTQLAWQIVVRLDNGQFATVTQANNPGVNPGDYVQIYNNQVYPH